MPEPLRATPGDEDVFSDHWDDPATEEAWCAARRAEVEAYLHGQGLVHGRIGEWPAWHVAPYVSLWAIESVKRPGWVGWWAIAGDCPTDYVSCGPERHPREALRAFAESWREVAACMLRGEEHPSTHIGRPDDWPELGPLLQARAEILDRFAADDGLWEGDVFTTPGMPPRRPNPGTGRPHPAVREVTS